MIKNNVFSLLLITCAAISVAIPNFAMETDLDEEEQQWKISGDFNQLFRPSRDSLLNRQVEIKALSKNNYIKEIGVYGYSNDAIMIRIEVAFHQENIDNDMDKFIYEPRASNLFVCNSITDSSQFLNAFYKRDLIPDFIIDRIIKDVGIEDFRMDGDRFIQLINQQINETSTAKDFMRIVNEELEKIKNSIRTQNIIWDLIRNLKDSGNFDKNVVISLCEKIRNPNLPFYTEVKLMEVNLTRDSAKIIDVEERFQKIIISLLSANKIENPDVTEQLNLYVKAFYHNDIPGDDFPDDLKNLSLSPESMFKLLNFIRKQNLELDSSRK